MLFSTSPSWIRSAVSSDDSFAVTLGMARIGQSPGMTASLSPLDTRRATLGFLWLLSQLFLWRCFRSFFCGAAFAAFFVALLSQLFLWRCFRSFFCGAAFAAFFVALLAQYILEAWFA